MSAFRKTVDGVAMDLSEADIAQCEADRLQRENLPQAGLLAYAANRRWEVEMGGTTYAGMPIATDRESRAIMSQSVLYLREKPVDETIDWKGPGGWVNLDLASLTAATLAAGDHVDATFRREKAIAAAIASGAVNSIAQIDEAFADVTRAWAI